LKKLTQILEEISMKRLLTYALLFPAFFILANVFSTQLEAQRYNDRQNNDRQNQDKVCFYVDENYQGDSFCANPGESMRNIGSRYNDRITSIRVPNRLEVTIYDDENFGGGRLTINRDTPNLRDWNDRFSSFRVSGETRGGGQSDRRGGGYESDRRDKEPRNGACFYVDENFRGRSFCLDSGQSERNVGGRFNDRITSMRVFGKARVSVYEDENFKGRGRDFNRDAPNLRGLSDRITSVRVR
jgi:hypothetical protein